MVEWFNSKWRKTKKNHTKYVFRGADCGWTLCTCRPRGEASGVRVFLVRIGALGGVCCDGSISSGGGVDV